MAIVVYQQLPVYDILEPLNATRATYDLTTLLDEHVNLVADYCGHAELCTSAQLNRSWNFVCERDLHWEPLLRSRFNVSSSSFRQPRPAVKKLYEYHEKALSRLIVCDLPEKSPLPVIPRQFTQFAF